MKKRVAVLTHYYPPEPCAGANRAASLVRALVSEGNDVTVVTNFPTFPDGRLRADDRRLARVETVDQARVVRLFTRRFNGIPGARLYHWLLAALGAAAYLVTSRRRFDSIIVTTPPITIALPALAGAWRHRAKLIVDVRDVFPDIAVAMGTWPKDGLLTKATERVARLLYRRAELVTAVTETALRQIASRGVESRRLLLAPNGFDAPSAAAAASRPQRAANFLALYAGNLGLTTDVDVLLDAAALLRSHEGIEIWIAGDGAQGDYMRKRVAGENLDNVRLWGSVSRPDAMQMIAGADVVVVPLRKGISESIPTKIFDALSVGCPVLVAGEGEARNTALASGGGIAIPPGNAPLLAAELLALAGLDKAELVAKGARGMDYVQRFYRRESIMLDYTRRIAAL